MTHYILRRFLWLIPVILVVSVVTFFLMHNTPGGPWDIDLSLRQVDATTQRQLNDYYGLDKPLWRQYVAYMIGDFKSNGAFQCGAICLNLGPSYRQRGSTIQTILFKPPEDLNFLYSKFGYSLRLALLAMTMAILIGFPVGILSALKQNSWIDYVSLFFVTIGVSVPGFVMAIFLIILFGATLHLLPIIPDNWDNFNVWIMPAIVLGFGVMARTARLTRSSMLEVMRQDYVRTARAKGLAERIVIFRHMVKNALIPVVTYLGPALAMMITGAFIIEYMFGFPGIGREFVVAIQRRDYSMIMGSTLLFAVMIAVANLLVDLVYTFLDPRIKLTEGGR
jgi:oligopeptide transport system permease protein